jgi:hypothetical protein
VLLCARDRDEAVDLQVSGQQPCRAHSRIRVARYPRPGRAQSTRQTYLMWATLSGRGGGSLMKDVGARGDVTGGRLLAVTAPVGARLRVQARGSRVLVPLRHVLGRGSVGRILAVRRICRAGTCDGRIYRQSAVRLGLLRLGVLMAAPI